MKRVIKWGHYYCHHVNIYIDADNPPFVDYFPRETMGFPHLCKRLPWRSYSWDLITKHVVSWYGWGSTIFFLWLKIKNTSWYIKLNIPLNIFDSNIWDIKGKI